MEESTMSERTALLDDVDHFSDTATSNGYTNADTNAEVEIKAGRTYSDIGPADTSPIDRYFFVYAVFYIFGMCSVLPWNMFITAQNYFDYKFANHASNSSTPNGTLLGVTLDPTPAKPQETQIQDMYESYFSIAAQVPNVIVQLLNTILKHKITLKVRMFTSLTGMLVIFIFTTVLTRVNTNDWELQFFWITLASVIVVNCFSAVFQGSVFGLGGLLPKKYTQALMAGQGLGGIVPALVSIICLATLNDNSLVGFVYFLVSVVCILITYAAYIALPRNQFAEYYLNKQASPRTGMLDISAEFSSSFEEKKTSKPPFWTILSQIWVPGTMVLLTFAVTLGNFPGVISQIESMNFPTEWADKYFAPVFCFLLFNAMDYLGRSMSVIQQPSQNHMGILSLLVTLRLGFFPLFALCNVSPDKRNSEVVFTHDAYPITFMFFFAFSNGYLSSLCMMYGPKFVKPEHQETAGNMMAFFLVLGLAVGSAISALVLFVL